MNTSWNRRALWTGVVCAALIVGAAAQEAVLIDPLEEDEPPAEAELVPAPTESDAPAPAGAPTTRLDGLEPFLDGVIETVMEERLIPGSVMVVVENGQVVLSKGYGFSNVDTREPIRPDKTLFRIASISKTVNATAVMQLVERGLLDLEAKANDLLRQYNAPFTIVEHYPEPIRLIDLLNHTAGFDERAIGMAALAPEKVPPLGEYLTRRLPPQTMPPRETISYSNHGVALAGYLVELASGQPYASYVRDHIFTPLGMTRSTFECIDPKSPDIPRGYTLRNGRAVPVPIDYPAVGPAGSMLSTGEDMARYMIAHLNKGRLGDTRIFSEATAEEMHRLHYRQDPRLDGGMAVGFFTGLWNGHRFVEHGGNLNGFASQLFLLPDDGVGFFLSSNVDDGQLRDIVVRQFMDRYFPDTSGTILAPSASLKERAKQFEGKYRLNRYARKSIEKLATLPAQMTVLYDGAGALVMIAPNGEIRRLYETEPGLFRWERDRRPVVFRVDASGNATHLLMTGAAFERLRWYERSSLHHTFLIIVVLLLLSAVVGWPIAALLRRLRKQPRPAPKRYRVLAGLLAAMALYLIVMLFYTLTNLDQWEFVYGMPLHLMMLLCLPPLVVAGSFLMIVAVIMAWARAYFGIWGRVHYTLVILACLSLLPFFRYWNLLGFNW